MTIDKASNTLSAMQEDYPGDEFPNEEGALKLAIEAFDMIKYFRSVSELPNILKLPGETFE